MTARRTGIWYLTDYAMNFNINITTQGAAILSRQIRQAERQMGDPAFRLYPDVGAGGEIRRSTKPNLAFHLYGTWTCRLASWF